MQIVPLQPQAKVGNWSRGEQLVLIPDWFPTDPKRKFPRRKKTRGKIRVNGIQQTLGELLEDNLMGILPIPLLGL